MAGARGIYGLSGSGIDVESLVKVGMMSEQKKYDRIYKKEVETEWRKEAFADVYSAVNTFRSSMSDMRLSSRTKPMTATSSLSDAVTATANANAGVMSHTVEVTQAASNASSHERRTEGCCLCGRHNAGRHDEHRYGAQL